MGMSPFAEFLRHLRNQRQLRQRDLACRLGVNQSYISALELGIKGPPPSEFAQQLLVRLNLTEQEFATLVDALVS